MWYVLFVVIYSYKQWLHLRRLFYVRFGASLIVTTLLAFSPPYAVQVPVRAPELFPPHLVNYMCGIHLKDKGWSHRNFSFIFKTFPALIQGFLKGVKGRFSFVPASFPFNSDGREFLRSPQIPGGSTEIGMMDTARHSEPFLRVRSDPAAVLNLYSYRYVVEDTSFIVLPSRVRLSEEYMGIYNYRFAYEKYTSLVETLRYVDGRLLNDWDFVSKLLRRIRARDSFTVLEDRDDRELRDPERYLCSELFVTKVSTLLPLGWLTGGEPSDFRAVHCLLCGENNPRRRLLILRSVSALVRRDLSLYAQYINTLDARAPKRDWVSYWEPINKNTPGATGSFMKTFGTIGVLLPVTYEASLGGCESIGTLSPLVERVDSQTKVNSQWIDSLGQIPRHFGSRLTLEVVERMAKVMARTEEVDRLVVDLVFQRGRNDSSYDKDELSLRAQGIMDRWDREDGFEVDRQPSQGSHQIAQVQNYSQRHIQNYS